MNQEKIVKIFEGVNIEFIQDGDDYKVSLEKAARFCGWTRIANSGNEVIKWSLVEGYLKEIAVPSGVHAFSSGVHDIRNAFISEKTFYTLILTKCNMSQNEVARRFMLWVVDTITELRRSGYYVMPGVEKEYVIFDIQYGIKNIKNTFLNSNDPYLEYESFMTLLQECVRVKLKRPLHCVKLFDIIGEAMQQRIGEERVTDNKQSLEFVLNDVKVNSDSIMAKEYKKAIEKTKKLAESNKRLRAKNKKLLAKAPAYIVIEKHPFSVNDMYIDNADGSKHRTEKYNEWFNDVLRKINTHDFSHVDLKKKTIVWLKFDYLPACDLDNCIKSILDVIAEALGNNDNKVIKLYVEAGKRVSKKKDGKIYIAMRNVK